MTLSLAVCGLQLVTMGPGMMGLCMVVPGGMGTCASGEAEHIVLHLGEIIQVNTER